MQEKFIAVNDTFVKLTKRIKKKSGVRIVSKTWVKDYEKACRKLQKAVRQNEQEYSELAASLEQEKEAAAIEKGELEKKLSLYKKIVIAMPLAVLVLSFSYVSLYNRAANPLPEPVAAKAEAPEPPAGPPAESVPPPAEASPAPAPPTPDGTVYTIQPGDTLSDIAFRFYGKGALWTVIYEANAEVLADPHLINEGIVIKIP